MTFDINQKKDFKIKPANFAGSLKPDKVAKRATHDSASGATLAGKSDTFGNKNT